MKRLVLCFDGTWNAIANPGDITNVVRIANNISLQDAEGTDQICYYNSGVGSGGPIDRFIGGVFGYGLKSNVKRGLAFLALNYSEGDEVYVFGFSRGAYTARALAGVLGVAGIPKQVSDAEVHWEHYRRIAKLQSNQRGLGKDSKKYKKLQAQIDTLRSALSEPTNYKPEEVNIACVGVFDTVGSYGVPAGFGLSGLPHLFTYWTRGFRSRKIGSRINVALHAIAVDEMRRPFSPTFWTLREDEHLGNAQVVEQMWFPGVHSNIGGGYADCGLSDLSLAWMISKIREHTKLAFDESELFRTIWPCSAGVLYRSSRGGPLSVVRSVMPPAAARGIDGGATGKGRRARSRRVNEQVHWSVGERCALEKAPVDGAGLQKYAPTNLKAAEFSQPTALERALRDPKRPGRREHCPLSKLDVPCWCAARVSGTASPEQAKPHAAA